MPMTRTRKQQARLADPGAQGQARRLHAMKSELQFAVLNNTDRTYNPTPSRPIMSRMSTTISANQLG